MTSGIGLPYINIAVAESADRLVRSFDVTLCKHCVLQRGPRKRPLPCSPLAITHCAAAGMCERSHIPAAAPRWRMVYEFVRMPHVYYRLF